MKIISTHLFMNEVELLLIRLEELYDYVDYFVLVQSEITVQDGSIQPFFGCYEKNKHLFKKYEDKIHVFNLTKDMSPEICDYPPMPRRNAIFETLRYAVGQIPNLDPNDLVMFGDADEIPNRNIVKQLKTTDLGKLSNNEIRVLQLDLFYFFFNYRLANTKWNGLKILNVNTFLNTEGIYVKIRQAHDWDSKYIEDAIQNAGWHYSYFGGVENIQHKMRSLCDHSNRDVMSVEEIEDSMKKGKDLFGRNECVWEILNPKHLSLPIALQNNPEKYKEFFSQNYN
jgi:beta-1,4-mannosyl-glycoprotein beta-1,4-N-acetylglucosaminyltransferase